MSNSNNVTSRGASREFVIRVLQNSLEWCRIRSSYGERISMPFPKAVVQSWIDKAKQQSGKNSMVHMELGGTIFDAEDPSTHWRTSAQFFTWFKNNVERRSKYEALIQDSRIPQSLSDNTENIAVFQRARYCQSVVSLTTEIKAFLRRRTNVSTPRNHRTAVHNHRYIQNNAMTPNGVDLLESPLLFNPDQDDDTYGDRQNEDDHLFSSVDDCSSNSIPRINPALLFRPIEFNINNDNHSSKELHTEKDENIVNFEKMLDEEEEEEEEEEDLKERDLPEDEHEDDRLNRHVGCYGEDRNKVEEAEEEDDDELTAMEVIMNEPMMVISTFDNLGVGFDEVVTMIDSFGSSDEYFVPSLSSPFNSSLVSTTRRSWKSENDLDVLGIFSEEVDSMDFEVFNNDKKRSRVF